MLRSLLEIIALKFDIHFEEGYTHEAKNCDLDLSVEWFQLLFRKIRLTSIINEGNIDIREY